MWKFCKESTSWHVQTHTYNPVYPNISVIFNRFLFSRSFYDNLFVECSVVKKMHKSQKKSNNSSVSEKRGKPSSKMSRNNGHWYKYVQIKFNWAIEKLQYLYDYRIHVRKIETFPITKAHMPYMHTPLARISLKFNFKKKWSMCHLFSLKMHLSYFLKYLYRISTKNGTNHLRTHAKDFNIFCEYVSWFLPHKHTHMIINNFVLTQMMLVTMTMTMIIFLPSFAKRQLNFCYEIKAQKVSLLL